jgi:5-formyltetrahydrofolate cyclo-ligase
LKKKIRAELLRKRDSILPELKAQKEAAIRKRLYALEEFRKSGSLLMYVSFRSEVDTRGFLQDILNSGKKLVLPLVDPVQRVLKLYEIKETSELAPGYMGIPEPERKEDRRVDVNDVDLIIIPGAGFDVKGNRLGYGGGYYDKLLSPTPSPQSLPPSVIALAFEEQIGEEIPSEPHDIKVDIIITDKRLIRCKEK